MGKSIKEITDFESLVEFQKNINPNSGIMKGSDYSEIKDYIHTGSFILNACITGRLLGGIPSNKVIAFAGDSQTSKTLTCLNVARNAQKLGYYVVYYDTENAVTNEMMENFGVDTNKVLYSPISIVEDLKSNLVKMMDGLTTAKRNGKDVPKLMIIIDSLSQLGTKKSYEDTVSGKDVTDMTRARQIKLMFQLITNQLAELKYPLLFTNHTYENMGTFVQAHEKVKVTGGKSVEYTASVILHFSRKQLDEDKGKSEKTGITVQVKPIKNRFIKQKIVSFQIPWSGPINPYVGLEQFIEISDEELAMEIWSKVGIGRGSLKETKPGIFEFTFKPRSTTWAVRHLGENVKRNDSALIFSDKVFTSEVIYNLDEFVYREFKYSSDNSNSDYVDDLFSFLEDDIKQI